MDEQSFMKALFFGVIAEDVIFPFPRFADQERQRLHELVEQVRGVVAEHVDAAEIDRSGAYRAGDCRRVPPPGVVRRGCAERVRRARVVLFRIRAAGAGGRGSGRFAGSHVDSARRHRSREVCCCSGRRSRSSATCRSWRVASRSRPLPSPSVRPGRTRAPSARTRSWTRRQASTTSRAASPGCPTATSRI